MVRNTRQQIRTAAQPELIVVLYSVVESMGRGTPADITPDRETEQIAASVDRALRLTGGNSSMHAIRTADDVTRTLSRFDPATTLVFNLCEGLDNDTAAGEYHAAQRIAKSGLRYTGADPLTLERCLDKGRTHELLGAAGVPAAKWIVVRTVAELAGASIHPARTVGYPAIVKPALEDCSLAITSDSVVDSDAALLRQVRRIIEEYRQPALVEQFLDGREFSVSIRGYDDPEVVGTGQIDFADCSNPRDRIETYENKWSDRFTGVYPAPVSSSERDRLEQIGLSAYRALSCSGYARVDVREDSNRFHVLEVNPNPSLAEDAGFARAAAASGVDYAALAGILCADAWSRQRRE